MILQPGMLSQKARLQQCRIEKPLSEIINEELKKLSQGQILFNPPNEMRVGIKERIEARLAKTLSEDLSKGLRGRGISQIEKINIGPLMNVTLTGDNFEIKTLSHEEQVVPSEGFTQWNWDVIPNESGLQILTLIATVRIKLPNYGEEKKDCPIFERQIKVRVNPIYSSKRFLRNYWQWLGSTIIGSGLIGWFLKKRKAKRKKYDRKT